MKASGPRATPTRAGATWCISTGGSSPARYPGRGCARYLGIEADTLTDREGYFRLEIAPRGRLGPGPWQEVALELLEAEAPVKA